MLRQVVKITKPGVYDYLIKYCQVGQEKEWVGVVRADKKGEYSLWVRAEHRARDTKGRVIVRAVASGGARVSLSGMIKIYKQAQGTDSFLELRVLLLDDKSSAIVDPQLEIEANEVKAGHAASVSGIDKEAMQYLMSRGLSRRMAEREIVEGFLMGGW